MDAPCALACGMGWNGLFVCYSFHRCCFPANKNPLDVEAQDEQTCGKHRLFGCERSCCSRFSSGKKRCFCIYWVSSAAIMVDDFSPQIMETFWCWFPWKYPSGGLQADSTYLRIWALEPSPEPSQQTRKLHFAHQLKELMRMHPN
jgi:hypothetical protein